MINAGIHHNDILIIDRSIAPSHGKIVIGVVDGELTVKRLHIKGKDIQLLPVTNDIAFILALASDIFWVNFNRSFIILCIR